MNEFIFTILVSTILIILLLILCRLVFILPCCNVVKRINNDEKKTLLSIKGTKNIMILLGSGGHTGEMIRILEQWSSGINRLNRSYIISSGDSTSILKLKDFEDNKLNNENYKIFTIYRARNIGEGKLKAFINTLLSFKSTLFHLILNKEFFQNKPDIFLTNGPGTAIPITYLLFILKFFGLVNTKIVYIESLARVKELSLTGLLILPISDRIIVQWEPLSKKYRRCEYYGILV